MNNIGKLSRVIHNPYKIPSWIIQTFPVIGHCIPDRNYLQIIYRGMFNKILNIDNPKTFNEKLQWLKLNDHNPQYTLMVDKYEVKRYVSERIGSEYIIPTIGVWERFDDIDFTTLPNQFVLKCTHDSGGLAICRDKSQLNITDLRKKINKCLKRNYYWNGREWPYKNVEPRIIAEEYMEEKTRSLIYNSSDKNENKESEKNKGGLVDYKFFCFNGNPILLYISKGLEDHSTAEISFYNMEGNEAPFCRSDYKQYHNAIFPNNFEKMKRIATDLAKEVGSPFVRIDLYSINDHIYFSEITFTPCSGMIPFEPESADEELGKKLVLPYELSTE